MSRDRKLRLVSLEQGAADVTTATDDAANNRADVAGASELVRAANAPPDLQAADNEMLIALALGDDVCEISDSERQAADQLRMAIDSWLEGQKQPARSSRPELTDSGRQLLELAQALRAASGPARLDELTNERMIKRALGSEASAGSPTARPSARRAYRSITVGAVLAAAAAVALFIGTMSMLDRHQDSTAAHGPTDRPARSGLIPTRSTQSLFDPAKPFARIGGESARLDRIARARAADLRANRFAAWGVR